MCGSYYFKALLTHFSMLYFLAEQSPSPTFTGATTVDASATPEPQGSF